MPLVPKAQEEATGRCMPWFLVSHGRDETDPLKVGRTEAPMRQPQHKRNVRARNRRQPNPINRVYESNGPDVKVRGTAQHIAEKYMQLGRDALSGGDTIKAESYFQHAEHYLRIIAAAQEQIQQRRQQQQEAREQRMRGNGRTRSTALAASTQNEESPVAQPIDPVLASSDEEVSSSVIGNGAEVEVSAEPATDAATTTDTAKGNGGAGEAALVLQSPAVAETMTKDDGGTTDAVVAENDIGSSWEGPQPSFLVTPALPAGADADSAVDTVSAEDSSDTGSEAKEHDAEAETTEVAAEKTTTTKRRRTRRTRVASTRRTRKTATQSDDSSEGAADSPSG